MSTSKLNSKPGSYTSAISIPSRADGWSPNPRDISQTPGGTMYATTPGGNLKLISARSDLILPKINLSLIIEIQGKYFNIK